ncbi:glycerate kinase [Egicoccus halophilus]|uniref:Glycerate kinase n=1 Tax=Egicoccus halophilus TaxID=1670830 RepID=A0A8J3A8Q6_9ACTN|nr:glycerate kinase [Egicoccus halophilus]GGI07199.1 hypothetical protein GCM10011354_22890 [Egicoccus halophilus]
MKVGAQVGARVVFVTESIAGVSAPAVAAALAEAWRERRPDDDVATLAVSDGGPGLIESLARPGDTELVTEVAGPHGHPLEAPLLLREDATAVVEAARVAGAGLAPEPEQQVRTALATTYGVGELLRAARDAGARRILVGVGGVAAVDGGTGALTGLGFRLRVTDGSGLKIGADDLHRVAAIERGWSEDVEDLEVVVLTDTDATLAGAAPEVAPPTADDLVNWAAVAERDLGRPGLAGRPGTGAGGGTAFGLAAGLGARLADGVEVVWEAIDGDAALARADRVVLATVAGSRCDRGVRARLAAAGRRALVVAPPQSPPAADARELLAAVGAALDASGTTVAESVAD